MKELRETLNKFEDLIRKDERSKLLIENNKLKQTIKVLISALRYERGVNDIIDFIDALPDFQLKESDINRICLFVDTKKIKKGESL